MSRETTIVQHFGFGTVSLLWTSSPSGAVVLSNIDKGLINAFTKSGAKSNCGHGGQNESKRFSHSYYFSLQNMSLLYADSWSYLSCPLM